MGGTLFIFSKKLSGGALLFVLLPRGSSVLPPALGDCLESSAGRGASFVTAVVIAVKSSEAQVDAKLSELLETTPGRAGEGETECAEARFEITIFEIEISVTGIMGKIMEPCTTRPYVHVHLGGHAATECHPGPATEGRDMESSKFSFCRRDGEELELGPPGNVCPGQ
jgi:hypothetical protein